MENLLILIVLGFSLVAFSFIVLGSLWILLSEISNREHGLFDSNSRWPPIDDDEFIRRCDPGVNRDIALRVRRIVSQQLGVPYDRIHPDQNFVNDLGCD
jgi:hypothetical protein